MTRAERRGLLVAGIVLAVVCSALFARAVLAERTADLARAQARAALLPTRTSPSSDVAERTMLRWSGATQQMRYWQALQRFRVVTAQASKATQYTLLPSLPLVFKLEETVTFLRRAASEDGSSERRSRLDDMLGLAYVDDAELHQGEDPIEPQLDGKAIASFRQAVLLDGSDDAAKTNLELLLRRQQTHKTQRQHPTGLPDQTRAENALQNTSGLPSQNGSVGRRFSGGY